MFNDQWKFIYAPLGRPETLMVFLIQLRSMAYINWVLSMGVKQLALKGQISVPGSCTAGYGGWQGAD